MFSNLGPLFKTTFRRAESNDTRQKIPHEEHNDERKKQNEQPKKENHVELWEDEATVSVQALRAFLINFINEMPEIKHETAHPSPPTNINEDNKPRATNSRTAQAVQAYQNMAAQSSDSTFEQPKQQKPLHNQDVVESRELRDMYQLIDKLDILDKKGVQMLEIKKAGTFVESLTRAVNDLL